MKVTNDLLSLAAEGNIKSERRKARLKRKEDKRVFKFNAIVTALGTILLPIGMWFLIDLSTPEPFNDLEHARIIAMCAMTGLLWAVVWSLISIGFIWND